MNERALESPAGATVKEPAALTPTRDPRVTLPDLVEVLLNKGVYLNLDLIISVADIPLIGVNLRATIAGMETMLEYGMMRNWDERTRAWVRNSVARHLPLVAGEEIVARMAGGHLDTSDPFERLEGPSRHSRDGAQHLRDEGGYDGEQGEYDDEDAAHGIWRPGTLYLTTHRLIAYRRDPQEILWQAARGDIRHVEVETQRSIGGEDRNRLRIHTTDDTDAVLSATEPERLRDLLHRQGLSERQGLSAGTTSGAGLTTRDAPAAHARTGAAGRTGESGSVAGAAASHTARGRTSRSQPALLAQARMWLREQRSKDPIWRGGTGTFDLDHGLTWKGPLDSRPALRLRAEEIDSTELIRGHSPLRGSPILAVRSGSTEVHLATDHPDRWVRLIQHVQQSEQVER